MLSSRDAFKVGFLARCAAAGLSAGEIAAAAAGLREKLAALETAAAASLPEMSGRDKGAGFAGDAAKWVGLAGKGLKTVGQGALPWALGLPIAAGAAGGMALAKLTDMDDTDVAAVKNQELVDAYRRHAEQLRRQRRMRQATHLGLP